MSENLLKRISFHACSVIDKYLIHFFIKAISYPLCAIAYKLNSRKVRILLYHSVGPCFGADDLYALNIEPELFRQHMKFLRNHRYNVASLDEVAVMLKRGGIPPRTVCITFDDGYENNYEYAFPILRSFGFSATIFLLSGYMDNKIFPFEGFDRYNNRRPSLRKYEVSEMAHQGVTFGNHTANHIPFDSLSNKMLYREIIDSKEFLETFTGMPIKHFSYPHGATLKPGKNTTELLYTYDTISTTMSGFNVRKDSVFDLKRTTVCRTDSVFTFKLKIYGVYDFIYNSYRLFMKNIYLKLNKE